MFGSFFCSQILLSPLGSLKISCLGSPVNKNERRFPERPEGFSPETRESLRGELWTPEPPGGQWRPSWRSQEEWRKRLGGVSWNCHNST